MTVCANDGCERSATHTGLCSWHHAKRFRLRVKKYPWAPLVPLLASRLTETADAVGHFAGVTDGRIAELFEVHPRQVIRFRQDGLTAWAADRFAIRLGWMPWQIWDDYLEDGLHPIDLIWPLSEWWRPAAGYAA